MVYSTSVAIHLTDRVFSVVFYNLTSLPGLSQSVVVNGLGSQLPKLLQLVIYTSVCCYLHSSMLHYCPV